jgi:hypothetical protein
MFHIIIFIIKIKFYNFLIHFFEESFLDKKSTLNDLQ